MEKSDLHVHTEYSWDAPDGLMEESCRQAVKVGLSAVAFTEHADGRRAEQLFDVQDYAESIERCRTLFPELRILSGVELGEPHRFVDESRALLDSYSFDLVLGSCHSIPLGDRLVFIGSEETLAPDVAHESVRAYFAETLALIERAPVFSALTHLDYPKRYWPHEALPYQEKDFEEEYRAILAAAAKAGLTLEINTEPRSIQRGPCPGPVVVRWWKEAGGKAVSFGSDAHEPKDVMSGFEISHAIAEGAGFRPANDTFGLWLA